MKHFIQIDTHGYVTAYTFSDFVPSNQGWIEINTPTSLETNGMKNKLVDGMVETTSTPAFPPSSSSVWDRGAGAWVVDSVLLADNIKAQRNQLLQQSDWTQLPDVPLATKEVWATYRQALRDLTAQPGYPLDIVWPEPPA